MILFCQAISFVGAGLIGIPGKTILDKRRYARENLDHLRVAEVTRLILRQ
jgi:hypothetical protein